LLNCFIQDKIGSGFDISAAIYGSHIFRRYQHSEDLSKIVDLIKRKEDATIQIRELCQKWQYEP
jgi:phosphomevalonate kinase